MGGWDGWMGGWVDGWMGGWVGGWVDGWMGGWTDGRMDGWVGFQSTSNEMESNFATIQSRRFLPSGITPDKAAQASFHPSVQGHRSDKAKNRLA